VLSRGLRSQQKQKNTFRGNWMTWIFALSFTISAITGSTAGQHGGSVLGHSLRASSERGVHPDDALRQPGTGAFTNWIFYVTDGAVRRAVSVFRLTGVTTFLSGSRPHTRHICRMGILDRWIPDSLDPSLCNHAPNDIY